MYGTFISGKVQRMVPGLDGQDHPENVTIAQIKGGKVLTLKGDTPEGRHKPAEFDNFERETQQIFVETIPGRPPHRVFSGEADVITKLRALKRGDVVNVSGVQFRDGRVRIEKLEIVNTQASTAAR